MEFPRYVFKSGGPLAIPNGTYDQALVEDQTEYDAAIKGGWFPSIPEAIDGATIDGEVIHDDTRDPTRAELEAKAKELGIEFSPRIGDVKLGERIQAALDAQTKAPEA